MFDVISLENTGKWNDVIHSCKEFDFYHLAEYHRLDHSGTPLLLHFEREEKIFAFPVVLRTIEGSEYTDITSVYGYCGPLTNLSECDPGILSEFQAELSHFFESRKVVSVFSRLHPLLSGQKTILTGMGEVADVNTTICIDLKLPEKEQKRQYVHSLKNDINRLKKNHVIVRNAENKEDIDLFISLYIENMKRVNAGDMYFFPPSYFYDFLESIDSFLLLAFLDEKVIGGAIFTQCQDIMQVHLSATKTEYLNQSPIKIIWDEARKKGVENQMKYLHLGGGFNGKNDSLFLFKSQFSERHCNFSVWKYIPNEFIYNELVFQRFGNKVPKNSYFPAYRR